MSKTILVACDLCGKEIRKEFILGLAGIGELSALRELENEIENYLDGKFPKNITHLCEECKKGLDNSEESGLDQFF